MTAHQLLSYVRSPGAGSQTNGCCGWSVNGWPRESWKRESWSEGQGTPQGASISPLLANVYLHHVLDLWADWWRRHHARGEVIIVRFADLCRIRHKSA